MPTYSVYDVVFASTIALPELRPADCKTPTFRFTLHSDQPDHWDTREWSYNWCFPDGTSSHFLSRHEKGYYVRFPDLADFSISIDEEWIRCRPEPGTPLATIKHLFLDQVLPLVLSSQGRLVLHGSASQTAHGAIAFIGQSGSGKSTLASSFSVKGCPILADDCVLVRERGRQLVAVPSYPGVRLWPETVNVLLGVGTPVSEVAHYSDKKRIAQDIRLPFCTEPAPLRRIYFLVRPEDTEDTSTISINHISPRDALIELVKHTFHLDVTDSLGLRREFKCLSRIAVLPLFYRLTFPREFPLLPAVHEAILQNLRADC
jgi:hypothetical protein